MTGNLDSYYYGSDRDYALFDTDPGRRARHRADLRRRLRRTPPITPSAGSGDLVWSPTTSESRILDVINGAHRTLLVEQEEMYDTDVINALIAAAQRGVQVKLAIIDECDLDPYLNTSCSPRACRSGLNNTAADPLYTPRQGDRGRLRAVGRAGRGRLHQHLRHLAQPEPRARRRARRQLGYPQPRWTARSTRVISGDFAAARRTPPPPIRAARQLSPRRFRPAAPRDLRAWPASRAAESTSTASVLRRNNGEHSEPC